MKNFKSFLKEEEYERFVQNNSQNVDIKKTPIFKYKDVTIMLIDGEEVRNKISVDFTMGGHEFVYDYVPENEVWIEDLKSDFDKLCTIIHELVERYIMGKYGTEYEEAHDIATKVEYQIRKKGVSMKNFKSFLKESGMSDLDILKQELDSILKEKYKIDLDSFQDQLLGGVADNISLEAILRIPKEELLKGIEVEFEHTSDPYKALEIALDHLLENPPESYKYYIGLEKMEKGLGI